MDTVRKSRNSNKLVDYTQEERLDNRHTDHSQPEVVVAEEVVAAVVVEEVPEVVVGFHPRNLLFQQVMR